MDKVIDLRAISPTDRAGGRAQSERLPGAQRALNSRAIAFITAVKDETQYRICLQYLDALEIPPGYAVERIAVFGGASMPECYQAAMEASAARYKIYLHADTYLVHQGFLFELFHLLRTYPRLGLVGVVGSNRLPRSGIFWVNNPLHSYGCLWQNSVPGFPAAVLGSTHQPRLHLMRFRSFVGDYLPAAVADGFFLATQYDIPWTRPEFGFEGPWDHVQALEFIKAGLEVGIVRQEAVWCLHRGPLEEPSREQRKRRELRLWPQAAALRELYPSFVRVPATRFYAQHRGVRTIPGQPDTSDPTREYLGVIVLSGAAQENTLRALRALLPQCDELKEVDYKIVVVSDGSTDGPQHAVRREFPEVNIIATPSDDGPARAYNAGLRHLGFPNYLLVMNDSVEVSTGALVQMVMYLREHASTAGVAPRIDQGRSVPLRHAAIMDLVRRLPRTRSSTLVRAACALVRGSVFFDVGLYDERFRTHRAVCEWSLRARRKGYTFTFLPEATGISRGGKESRRHRAAPDADRLVDTLWLVYKYGGRRWATALYGAERLLVKWFEFRWRHDREALRHLADATSRMQVIYRGFHAENRVPLQLSPRFGKREVAPRRG